MTKQSLLIHNDSLDVLDLLTDEDCGKLFRAMRAFLRNEKYELDKHLNIAFLPFKNQFERDGIKYTNKCKANKINGSKGGKAKASKIKPNVANGSERYKSVANVADNKNDNDNDNDNVKDTNKEKSKKENAPAALSLSYKERCKLFQSELRPFLSEYPREMLNDFYRYWVEPNKKGKMRWELEKTWRLDLRLKTWHSKGYKNYDTKTNSLEELYALPEEERNKRILKMFEDSEKQENELEALKIN